MQKENNYHIISSFIDGILQIMITGKLENIREPELNWDFFTRVNGMKSVKTLLVDITNLQGRPGVVSTYYHVRECPYYDLFSKIAVIDLVENQDYYSFHETTANNAGHNIRYFNNRDEAIMWLKNGSEGSSVERTRPFPFSEIFVSNEI